MKDLDGRIFLLAFQQLFFRHPRIGISLLSAAGTARAAFDGRRSRFREIFADRDELWTQFQKFNEWDSMKALLRTMESLGANLISYNDERYPKPLKEIYDPPVVFSAIGEIADIFSLPAIAVVGARKASRQGLDIAASLACELAARRMVVVSGLAAGIDAAAHRGSLHGGGPTIAVQGCGPDTIYPSHHRGLAQDIAGNGIVISEFPCRIRPERYNFPQRNRIISGLSIATVVVEAAAESGSLITAQFALEQGREVCAMPGPSGTPQHSGSNSLLRDGAAVVECAEDVCSLIALALSSGGFPKTSGHFKNDVDMDSPLLRALASGDSLSIDDLVLASHMAANEVLAQLARLAVAGVALELPGRRWRLRKT